MNEFQLYLYHVVKRFVTRQQIVYAALCDLRPDLIAFLNGGVDDPDDLLALADRHRNVPQKGEWGDWQYFVHGVGCRLTHTETGEPLEWDLPDLRIFDRAWLYNYFEWYLENTGGLQTFHAVSQQDVFNALEVLKGFGLIKESSEVHYRLPEKSVEANSEIAVC